MAARVSALLWGWYFTMAYPIDDSPAQILGSLFVGTFGVVAVGLACYDWGRSRQA